MLTDKIEKALNEQIAQEEGASYYYLAMASWCEQTGRPGAAKFLYKQSDEERSHMLKLFHYTNEHGGHAVVTGTKTPTGKFKSLEEVFETALQHELKVTKSIHALVDLCLGTKDYGTFYFLQWYVGEQLEEERQMRDILDLIRLAGREGRGEYFVDRELATLAAAPAA